MTHEPMLEGITDAMIEAGIVAKLACEFHETGVRKEVAEVWRAMEAARRPEAAHPCPTCGAATPADNEFCSDGFHAPGETYWPVDPEAVLIDARKALQFAFDMHRRARNTIPDEEEGLAAQVFCHHINQTDGPIIDAIAKIDAALNPSPALVSDEQTSAVKKGR
jgi:hypothetical protein